MRKHVQVVAGLFVGMGCLGTALAACLVITQSGTCPTLAPTAGGCALGCPTYFAYSASPVYTAGTLPGQCKNPYATTFSVGITTWAPTTPGACATGGNCGYVGTPGSVTCNTTTCVDFGC